MAKRKSVKRSGRKAAYKLEDILASGFEMPEDRADLVKVYRTMAKAADTRLARLEEYARQEGYKDATRWAYAKAKYYIKEWSGPEAEWFNTKPPESTTQLKQKMADIKTFLESVTSTKTGIREVHKKRAARINKEYGTDFTWQEVGTFFESELYEQMERDGYTSKTILRVVGRMRKNKKQIVNAIKNANAKDIKTSDNMADQLMLDVVEQYGPGVADYLTGKTRVVPK